MGTTELCPWCNSIISRERFIEIESKIRAEEQRKLAATEASLRANLKAEFDAKYEKQRQANEKIVQAENSKVIAKLVAERDAATKKSRDADARESQVRKEAKEDAEKAALKELQKQREALEKDRDVALLKKQAEFNRERDAWQKKVTGMERQIQKKTANQLGDAAEVDLYEVLREFFTEDRITRVPKGQNGADLIHEVRYKGQHCGRIVIDSKNRQSWQNTFVSKLRADQIAAEAEHAILSSSVFPSGKKEMCVESDVIVVSPARVVYIIQVLRRSMISMHVLGLSMKEKTDKTARPYKLITSDSYMRRFNEAVKLTEKILELDVEEEKTHGIVWRNRGALTKRMSSLLREIDIEVAAVVEGSNTGDQDVAAQPKQSSVVTQPAPRREAT